jgi:hypothetical protein
MKSKNKKRELPNKVGPFLLFASSFSSRRPTTGPYSNTVGISQLASAPPKGTY